METIQRWAGKGQYSLRSSLFRFLSDKRESREGSGTEVTKKLVAGGRGRDPLPPVPLFALAPCVRATSPWLSLSPAKRKRKRLLRRLGTIQKGSWMATPWIRKQMPPHRSFYRIIAEWQRPSFHPSSPESAFKLQHKITGTWHEPRWTREGIYRNSFFLKTMTEYNSLPSTSARSNKIPLTDLTIFL